MGLRATSDWTKSIRQLGFAIVPDVFTPPQMSLLIQELEHSSLHRTRAGIRHALKICAISSLAQKPGLTTIATEVLGANAFPFRATLFEKSAFANWLVVWHQDTALPLRERKNVKGWGPWSLKDGVNYAHAPATALSRVLALRVHLDDSSFENGPLRLLPATHERGVLTDDQLHHVSREIQPVDCVVAQGGIVAMRPLLVHASSKAFSASPRRVLHIEYASNRQLEAGLELAVT